MEKQGFLKRKLSLTFAVQLDYDIDEPSALVATRVRTWSTRGYDLSAVA